MHVLLNGFLRFRSTAFQGQAALYRELAFTGQNPRAAVVACCDSRVDPQAIFSAGPGDLFVIRNVANLVPPYHPNADYHGTSAALEFAVRRLKVPNLIVMGHTGCGGIRALLDLDVDSDFLGNWMRIAEGVRDRVSGEADPVAAAEREVTRQSLVNLTTFPWIAERIAAGELRLFGCLFDITAGDLQLLNLAGEVMTVSTDLIASLTPDDQGALPPAG
jgi:carbonic anhydrase